MIPGETSLPEKARTWKGISAGLIALALKVGPKMYKAIAVLVKGLKVGKLGLAATSMAVYSILFSWQFAAVIMVMLFVHESGHIWAMKRCGLKTKGMYFIPLLGAAAVSDEEFPSRGSESFIALMGPIWGFALAATAGVGYAATSNPFWAAAASWMAMINLLNLLPINPLDGGRVFKSIAYSIGSAAGLAFLIFGVIASVILATWFAMWLFLFLLCIGAIELVAEYKRRVQIPKMGGLQILGTFSAYAILTAVLWGLMSSMKHVPGAAAAIEVLK